MTHEVWIRTGIAVLLVVAIVVIVALIVERVQSRRPHEDDERLGIKITAAFTTYAVLLGFAILFAQQSYDDSVDALRSEAAAATTIARIASALPNNSGDLVLESLESYLKADVGAWNDLGSPTATAEGTRHLNAVYAQVMALQTVDGDSFVNAKAALLDSLSELERARIEREVVGREAPPFIWVMLIVGATIVLTLGTFLQFGSRRLRMFTLISMAILIVIALETIWILSNPLQGPLPIRPDPLVSLLRG